MQSDNGPETAADLDRENDELEQDFDTALRGEYAWSQGVDSRVGLVAVFCAVFAAGSLPRGRLGTVLY